MAPVGYNSDMGLFDAPIKELPDRKRYRIRAAVMRGRMAEDPTDVSVALEYGHFVVRRYRLAGVLFLVFGHVGALIAVISHSWLGLFSPVALLILRPVVFLRDECSALDPPEPG